MSAEPALLIGQQIVAGYGKLDILHGVDFEVRKGETVCMIGPNGAGKSTVFKVVYGFLPPRQGKVIFEGRDIEGLPPEKILRLGISFVPQGRSTFPQMTVRENLELGMFTVRDKKRIADATERVLLMFPRLKERLSQFAGTMSGGEQRQLEIGRALMLDPKLLILDEPSAGLSPAISKMIFNTLARLNHEFGVTIFMVEQNARQGLSISHRGYVLELGMNRYEGRGSDLLADENVRRMYLGGDHRPH
jgi:ABC-type branched-subunit amino acid transport system ATPase component